MSAENVINVGDWLRVTHPPPEQGGDGEVVFVRTKNLNMGTSTNPSNTATANYSDTISLDVVHNLGMKWPLKWHNCYSFGNGVESNRVGDVFNMPQMTPGVKVSTIFEEYKEERRKHGLIYSGLYNSTSGVNNLNQFIQAEKITKDVNPTYGSIQKLHARDTDLITLCEDKVLRILASKDAVYNADGNPQLTATDRVLGQTIPFIGEYGISKNPESFVSEAYRSYFTDKQRGAVMRLSRDGLTPISNHGMRDWFKDSLSTSRVNLLGENNLSYGVHNWDIPPGANLKIENGVAILGYYNDDIESNKFGLSAKLRKNGVLEVGKRYRFQFDTTIHSGLQREQIITPQATGSPMMQQYPTITLRHGVEGGWMGWEDVNARSWRSYRDNYHIIVEFKARGTDIEIGTLHVNSTSGLGLYQPPGASTPQTIQSWVEEQRVGYPTTHNPYVVGGDYLYGSTVGIKNLVLEEKKEEPKIIGSYDDRQDEYNLTIRGATWKTLSFREDVTGWVSFKSFVPEAAISCANDYYTIKDGKLWQHHIAGANNNTFYDNYTNSSLNVILNDVPGSVKSFHTLDYEGSDSRVEGVRNITVDSVVYTGTTIGTQPDGKYFYFTNEEWDILMDIINPLPLDQAGAGGVLTTSQVDVKQYRSNILIKTGPIKIWNDPLGGGIHGRWNHTGDSNTSAFAGDWRVGDVITTEQQEKTVNHFNSTPKEGWWVSNIETDKQKGNLPEFIEKEGKWFNYIKGIDSDISETTDFASFDIQGIGILDSTTDSNIVDMYVNTYIAPGFSIISKDTVSWDGSVAIGAFGTSPSSFDYISNVMNTSNILNGELYRLTLTVSNYTGTGDVGVAGSGGVSGSARISSNGTYTEDFVADGARLDLFGTETNSATIQFSVAQLPIRPTFSFTDSINSSLQIGDTLYFERPSKGLSNDIVDVNESASDITGPHATGYTIVDKNTVSWDGSLASGVGNHHPVYYFNNVMKSSDINDGKKYRLTLIISNYSGTEGIGVSTNGGVSGNARRASNGVWTEDFISNGGARLDLFGRATNSATIRLVVQEIITTGVLGFTRLEADNIQKCGVVRNLTSNTITVDASSANLPSANDYVLFSKNQAVNTSSLLGYYADVKLENNSKRKVEIFSLGSEITESSK